MHLNNVIGTLVDTSMQETYVLSLQIINSRKYNSHRNNHDHRLKFLLFHSELHTEEEVSFLSERKELWMR